MGKKDKVEQVVVEDDEFDAALTAYANGEDVVQTATGKKTKGALPELPSNYGNMVVEKSETFSYVPVPGSLRERFTLPALRSGITINEWREASRARVADENGKGMPQNSDPLPRIFVRELLRDGNITLRVREEAPVLA